MKPFDLNRQWLYNPIKNLNFFLLQLVIIAHYIINKSNIIYIVQGSYTQLKNKDSSVGVLDGYGIAEKVPVLKWKRSIPANCGQVINI